MWPPLLALITGKLVLNFNSFKADICNLVMLRGDLLQLIETASVKI